MNQLEQPLGNKHPAGSGPKEGVSLLGAQRGLGGGACHVSGAAMECRTPETVRLGASRQLLFLEPQFFHP